MVNKLSESEKKHIQHCVIEYLEYLQDCGIGLIETWLHEHSRGASGENIVGCEKFTPHEHYLDYVACVNVVSIHKTGKPLHAWIAC